MLASCGSEIKLLEWPSCQIIATCHIPGIQNSSFYRAISWCNSGQKLAAMPDGHFPIIFMPTGNGVYGEGFKYHEVQVPHVNTLAFSKINNHFITLGCESGHIFQYDVDDKTINLISTIPSPVLSVKYGVSGDVLGASCKNGQIYLFNASDKILSTYYVPNSWTVSAMAFHPKERNVLSGASKEGVVAIWDTATGHTKQKMQDHQSEVSDVAFSPSDWMFASTSTDYTLYMYDLRIGEKIFYKMFTQRPTAVAFPTMGNQFVVGTQQGRVITFDKRKLSSPKNLQVHQSEVRQFAFQNENYFDDTCAETVKLCKSEIINKNCGDQPSEIFSVDDLKMGHSGDADPESINWSGTRREARTWVERLPSRKESGQNSLTASVMAVVQEEICKTATETISAFTKEMNDRFLKMRMAISKDLAALESNCERRWNKFHSMIFDLGAQVEADESESKSNTYRTQTATSPKDTTSSSDPIMTLSELVDKPTLKIR